MSRPIHAARAATLALCALVACGDDDGDRSGFTPDSGTPPLDSGLPPVPDSAVPPPVDSGAPVLPGMDSGLPAQNAAYALLLALPDPDGVNLWYLGLQRELDFAALNRGNLITFPGNSSLTATAGHVFHGDDLTPTITKYRVTDDLKLEPVGDKLFFGAYPLPSGQLIDFHRTSFKDDNASYLHYGEDGAFRIHWDPTAGRIVKAHTDSNLPETTAQLELKQHGDLDRVRHFQGPAMEPFHTIEPGTYTYGDSSYIAVYDESTHVEKSVITVDACPGLEHASRDEQGNVYFATRNNIPGPELFGKKVASCVVRAKADGTLDPSFAKTDMRDYTGGHYVVHFSYFRDGKAIGYVLYEDRLGRTFEGEPPEAYADEVYGNSAAWELSLIDLQAKTAKPFTGLPGDPGPGAGGTVRSVDGRMFYSVANDNGTSFVYELSTDGTATFVANAVGQVYNIFRLR